MQEKEVLNETEAETRLDSTSTSSDSKDSYEEKKEKKSSKKEQVKESPESKEKSTFRRHKTKKDKNDPTRFVEGVNFKAKMIGVENVNDARGDKMCQDSLQRLKAAVKSSGEHKKKIIVNVSFEGIKIKEEKSGEVLYVHAVHLISFISQDVSDTRAFGYIFGSPDEGHQFIAIKTEKQACHVVLCLKDLFQAVLFLKQEKMVKAKLQTTKQMEQDKFPDQEVITDGLPTETKTEQAEESPVEDKNNEDHIYTDVILSIEKPTEDVPPIVPPKKSATIDDLLGLQDEIAKLQQGIEQMDSSMQAFANFDSAFPERDPFDTDYVIISKQEVLEADKEKAMTISPMVVMASSPITPTVAIPSVPSTGPSVPPLANQQPYRKESSTSTQSSGSGAIVPDGNPDKYAVFADINNEPSIFENPEIVNEIKTPVTSPPSQDTKKQEVTVTESFDQTDGVTSQATPTPIPAKPPRGVKASDASIFADLDPLGKGRPYLDKKDFFQELKNPPKKVMKEMVDKGDSSTVSRSFDLPASSGVDCCSMSPSSRPPPPSIPPRSSNGLSSSLPISLASTSLSVAPIPNSPFNPFNDTNNPTSTPSPPPPPIPARLRTRSSEPAFRILPSPPSSPYSLTKPSMPLEPLYASPVTNFPDATDYQRYSNVSSSPIPIPARQNSLAPSVCNGSPNNENLTNAKGSFDEESPTNVDFFGQDFGDFNGTSPGNGLLTKGALNLPNPLRQTNSLPKTCSALSTKNSYGDSNPYHSQNTHATKNTHTSIPPPISNPHSPTSRPRPRPSVAKGTSPLASTVLQLSVCPSLSVSASEDGVASSSGTKLASTIPLPNGVGSVSVPCMSNHKDIFCRKSDPFADDFFASIPKKTNDQSITSHEAL